MAYVYLIDMFQYIEKRLSEAENTKYGVDANATEKRFHEGRTEALSDFKQFLEKNYIQKLPNRIKKSYLDNRK